MVTLKFIPIVADGNEDFNIEVEGDTLKMALDKLHLEIADLTGFNILEDVAYNQNDCLHDILESGKYKRYDFSSPDDNFHIVKV